MQFVNLICLVLCLEITGTNSTLSEVWNRFMAVSCEFSSDLEKLLLPQGERQKRSKFENDEPNFDVPQELFDYLYPLAHLSTDDLMLEAQRSANGLQSHPIYTWMTELGTMLISECKERSGEEPEKYRTRNFGKHTESTRSRWRRSEGQKVQNKRRPSSEILNRKLTITKGNLTTTTTTTEAPTTTTADPGNSDDNFFSSYGGDIEYFFPLISFGIPFDGEITFLGFHGFKGLFPYK